MSIESDIAIKFDLSLVLVFNFSLLAQCPAVKEQGLMNELIGIEISRDVVRDGLCIHLAFSAVGRECDGCILCFLGFHELAASSGVGIRRKAEELCRLLILSTIQSEAFSDLKGSG